MTLNVNCLDAAASRAGLVDFLRTHKPDLIALQEVNLCTEELGVLVGGSGYEAFSNLDLTNPHARGTAMLWRSCIQVEDITVVEVDRLMYLRVGGQCYVNLYAPLSGRAWRTDILWRNPRE